MSLPSRENSFSFGSAASAHSLRDAIASYRRSQYLSINANVARSTSDLSNEVADDEESAILSISEDQEDNEYSPSAESDGGDYLVAGQFDEDVTTPGPSHAFRHEGPGVMLPSAQLGSPGPAPILRPPATEDTPLLRKAVSFTADTRSDAAHLTTPDTTGRQRRASAGSAKHVKYVHGGKSTFGQTLFNSIAILLGIGMLSEPVAFAYAGWIGGTALVISYGLIACYTAKILGRMILADATLRSYADIGQKAFGPRSLPFISAMFCLELFAVSVALVTLAADSLHTLFPTHDVNTYKLWGAFVLIPTVFMPLSLLSVTSILGIASTLFIVAVVLIDGLSKREAPGSLWQPAATRLLPLGAGELGISFGLFMAGFSGHAVIPSLARDMADPSRFDEMINVAFATATTVYLAIGGAGYLMFGRSVHDEISIDLLNTPGYSAFLNTLALWTFVISPLSKYALTTRPVNMTLEIMFGLEERLPPTAPDDQSAKPRTLTLHGHPPGASRLNLRRAGVVFERVGFTLASIAVSIFVPAFSSVMALIGAGAAFLLCVVGPLFAKRSIHGQMSVWDGLFIIIAAGMAVWGTTAAFWTAGDS